LNDKASAFSAFGATAIFLAAFSFVSLTTLASSSAICLIAAFLSLLGVFGEPAGL